MADIGEIKLGREIGKEGSAQWRRFIRVECPDCREQRWTEVRNYQRSRTGGCCQKCCGVGERHSNWRGGRARHADGYITIRLFPDDFFYSMADKLHHRVLEHRLVVAKGLGRCLQPWEIVHHKKGFAKDDNRYPETLQLVSDDRHKQITILENKIKRLEKENKELKMRIANG